MGEYVEVTRYPDCDICKKEGKSTPAQYDAKTSEGPWAYMCPEHFMYYGIGLGTGVGQKLIKKSGMKDVMDLPAEEESESEPYYFSTLDSLWQTAQEDYGASAMNRNMLDAFEWYADVTEGIASSQVKEWAKKRFPKLFKHP